MSFKGQVVWVTGASSGIGEAVTYAFANAGARLVISARRETELERVKAACQNRNNVLVLPMDLAMHSQMENKVQAVLAHFGRVDVMFHNAGLSQRSLAVDTSVEVDRKLMEVDYLGTVALTKALLPHMIQAGSGHFAVVTSLVGKFGSPMRSGYSAAKHALHGFFDSLRAEVYQHNIQVTLICPGFIATNISINALTGDGSAQNTMDTATANGLSAKEAARQMLIAIQKRKQEVYVGKFERIGVYLKRYLPGVFAWYLRRAKVT